MGKYYCIARNICLETIFTYLCSHTVLMLSKVSHRTVHCVHTYYSQCMAWPITFFMYSWYDVRGIKYKSMITLHQSFMTITLLIANYLQQLHYYAFPYLHTFRWPMGIQYTMYGYQLLTCRALPRINTAIEGMRGCYAERVWGVGFDQSC